jgi:hypothetical protein
MILGRVILATRPSGAAAKSEPPARIKTIELDRGWVQTNANTVAVMSQTELKPEESAVTLLRQVDGRYVETGSTLFLNSRSGRSSSTLSLSWPFPESFGLEHQLAAWEWIRSSYLHRPLRLVAGQPFEMFSVTNQAGAVFAGFIEYRLASTEAIQRGQSGTPVRVMVRLIPKMAMSGWLSLEYTVDKPAGYRVQGRCGGTAANDGEASTQWYFGSALVNPSVTWFVRGDFRTEDMQRGGQQMAQLRSKGLLEVTLGQPARVFSITNAFGETFEGSLELVGPVPHVE